MEIKVTVFIYLGLITRFTAHAKVSSDSLDQENLDFLEKASILEESLDERTIPRGRSNPKLTLNESDINQVLDQNLEEMTNKGTIKEPMVIKQISLKVGPVKFVIFDGEVRGFSTIYRTGDCNVTTDKKGARVFNIRVGISFIKVKAHFRVYGINVYDPYDLRTTTDKVDTQFSIKVVNNGTSKVPVLKKNELLTIEGLKVWKESKEEQRVSEMLFKTFKQDFTVLFKKVILGIFKEIIFKIIRKII